jgi:uncharacterized RDD family membrane protein YckC
MTPRTHVLGRRVVAFLIDLALVFVVCVPLFLAIAKTGPAGTIGTGVPASGANAFVDVTINNRERYITGVPAALFILFALVLIVVVFALAAAWWGATPGMRLLGLRVVGEDGGRVGLGRQLARTALWVIDAFPYVIPGGVAFLCARFSSIRQRVGDLVARTLVVARER